MAGRIFAILVMGILLLLLSALIRSAAAQHIGDALPSVRAIGLAAGAATLGVGGIARTMRAAWGCLCLLNGLASADAMAQAIDELGVPRPIGAALGVALLSGALGIAAVCLALVLLAASHLLLRRSWRAHRTG